MPAGVECLASAGEWAALVCVAVYRQGHRVQIVYSRAIGQDTQTEQVPAPAFVAERLPGVGESELVWVRRRTTTIDGDR